MARQDKNTREARLEKALRDNLRLRKSSVQHRNAKETENPDVSDKQQKDE